MSTDTEQEIVIAEADAPLASLSTEEQQQLTSAEAVIQSGLETFVKVGEALEDIRDGRLYRATHRSFSDYLAERWPQIGSRRQADRLIAAAGVERDLRPIGLSLTSESQARPLADLSAEQRRAAMAGAAAVAGDTPPTAKQVAQAATVVKPPAKPATSPPAPVAAAKAPAAPPATRPATLPPALPIAPSAPPKPLAITPLAAAAAGVDLQARKLLVAKRALLAAALDLVEQELERASAGPTIVISGAAAADAARLFVNAPALGGAATMLAFSATVEAPAPVVVEPEPAAPPTLFGIVEQKVGDMEARIASERLTGEEAAILKGCRADLDDLADDTSIDTAAYDALSARLGAAQAKLAELSEVEA
jgi:hypothetical protein